MRRLSINLRVARTVGVAAALAVVAGGATIAIRHGVLDAARETSRQIAGDAIDASAGAGLRLENLTVQGRVETSREDLLAAADVEQGTPILTIDVAKMRAAIEALPWVKSAQVERDLPDTIHIQVHERRAYALWQQANRYTLVDRDGHAIVDISQEEAAEQSLPLIVGADAPPHAAQLFAALETNPALASRIRAAVRVGERRWNLYLDSFENGIAVRFPEDDLAAAWTRLGALERDYKILERDLEFIDLRLDDRLIVRVRKDASAPKPAAKQPAPAASKHEV